MNYITAPFTWVYAQWTKFQAWVASIAPGVKVKLTAFLGLLGNGAFYMKDYLDQLPIEIFSRYLTAGMLLGMNMVLLTLIYWFRGLSK